MSNTTYSGSIALSKLKHVPFTTKKGAKCLLVPIEDNLLDVDDKGNVYLPVRVLAKSEEDEYGQHGFIAKSIGSKRWKDASEEQKEKWKEDSDLNPILGNIKNFGSGSGDAPANVGEKANYTDSDEDDLPF